MSLIKKSDYSGFLVFVYLFIEIKMIVAMDNHLL